MRIFLILLFSFLVFGCSKQTFRSVDSECPNDCAVINVELTAYIKNVLDVENDELIFNIYDHPPVSSLKKRVSHEFSPGTYRIIFGADRYGQLVVDKTEVITLKAGHVYEVKDRMCYFFSIWDPACAKSNDKVLVWIEDVTTGEIVAGEKWQ